MGDPLLPPSHRDEQAFNPRMILLHPGQVLLEGKDGTHEQLVSVISDKVIKRWHREFLKMKLKDSGSWPRSQEGMRRYSTSTRANDEP